MTPMPETQEETMGAAKGPIIRKGKLTYFPGGRVWYDSQERP